MHTRSTRAPSNCYVYEDTIQGSVDEELKPDPVVAHSCPVQLTQERYRTGGLGKIITQQKLAELLPPS